jgi:putative nucleotidyltransferase with HDIG domain
MLDLKSVELRIARATTLPALPHVVTHLSRLTNSEGASMRDYERVIAQDPAIASKVLRVANSSLYGGREITTLDKAIGMLGVNSVRSIATTVAMQSALVNKNLPRTFDVKSYWQHSLAVASAAKVLACLKKSTHSEEAFIAGLMHDIGKMALALYLPQEANFVYSTMQAQQIGQFEAEQESLGITHQDIGLLVARQWELPQTYQKAIAHHHTPTFEENEMDIVLAAVHVGNCIAHEAGMGGNPYRNHLAADPATLTLLAIPEAQFEPLKQAVLREITALSQQYAML